MGATGVLPCPGPNGWLGRVDAGVPSTATPHEVLAMPTPRARRPLVATALAALLAVIVAAPVGAATRPISERVSPTPLRGIVIAIDPGHNGGNASHTAEIARRVWIGTMWKPCNQTGTSTKAGYAEHRFNLLVSQGVKRRLEDLGATVRMTRTTNDGWGPCVDVRGRFGATVKAALLVSIHADGAASSARGFHILKPASIVGWTDDIVTASSRLATAMRTGMRSAGIPQANYYTTTGIKARRDLGTLNHADVPAILVECGNMKNGTDAARMTSSDGRAKYADGIVAGILEYFGKRP
jgi:N-acetylmuramoyl-L-alanine amidase